MGSNLSLYNVFSFIELGSRVFRKWLDHKDGALKNGIGAFTRSQKESPTFFHVRQLWEEACEEVGIYHLSLNLPISSCWHLQPSESEEINFCHLWTTQCCKYFVIVAHVYKKVNVISFSFAVSEEVLSGYIVMSSTSQWPGPQTLFSIWRCMELTKKLGGTN